MKQIKILLVITIFVNITCCKEKPENKSNTPKTEEKTEIVQPKESQQKINTVQLNNGKKWKANLETTEGIKKMQQLMKAFSDAKSPTGFATLKEELETKFAIIFEKCTMKGEAHNQLHNYLKPMVGLFDNLSSSNASKKSFQAINNHLSQYNDYFE